MPDLALHLNCPVCLGTTMEKVSIGPRSELQVDHCRRCGGFWLEHGEVQRLRSLDQASMWSTVARRVDEFRMRCHDCHGIMDRAEEVCPACGWKNALECPACSRPMLTEGHAGLRLDVCRDCRGVWFDHHELQSIWEESFQHSLRVRQKESGKGVAVAGDVAGEVLLHSLFFAPELVFYGARAAGQAAMASAEMISHLPGAIGAAPAVAAAAVEAAGDAAAGVFEIIVNIIAGIFDGL